MTLEDDDDVSGVFGVGAAEAIAPAKSAAAAPVAPAAPRTHVLPPQNLSGSAPATTIDRPYVSMSEDLGIHSMEGRRADSLSDRIGPVLMVITPLAAGMAGALKMLSMVEDFSAGAWYAVGAVFLILMVGSLVAGLVASGIFYVVRARWSILLRILFLASAASVAYLGIREVPSHVQVRENNLPGFVIGR